MKLAEQAPNLVPTRPHASCELVVVIEVADAIAHLVELLGDSAQLRSSECHRGRRPPVLALVHERKFARAGLCRPMRSCSSGVGVAAACSDQVARLVESVGSGGLR